MSQRRFHIRPYPTETLIAVTRVQIRSLEACQLRRGLHANCKDSEDGRSGTLARSLSSIGSQLGC